jgi:hypothetical protein
LSPRDELAVHTRRLVAVLAVRAHVIGRGERADDELPRLDRPHGGADLFDDFLARIGSTFRFDDIFADWAVANFVDDRSSPAVRFGYSALPGGTK